MNDRLHPILMATILFAFTGAITAYFISKCFSNRLASQVLLESKKEDIEILLRAIVEEPNNERVEMLENALWNTIIDRPISILKKSLNHPKSARISQSILSELERFPYLEYVSLVEDVLLTVFTEFENTNRLDAPELQLLVWYHVGMHTGKHEGENKEKTLLYLKRLRESGVEHLLSLRFTDIACTTLNMFVDSTGRIFITGQEVLLTEITHVIEKYKDRHRIYSDQLNMRFQHVLIRIDKYSDMTVLKELVKQLCRIDRVVLHLMSPYHPIFHLGIVEGHVL